MDEMNIASVRRRLRHAARLALWRWVRNGRSSLGFALGRPRFSDSIREIAAALSDRGICVRASCGDQALFDELWADAQRRYAQAWDGHAVRRGAADWKGDRNSQADHESKEFLLRLIPARLPADSVYLRYALQEYFLDAASAYLRLPAQLRAVHLWLNIPTPGAPLSTQLWHRDADDMANLKVFTYLSDVDAVSGPFAFAPGTHPFGARCTIQPDMIHPGRSEDGAMEKVVARSEWSICVGAAGTTVFADTCGFHKGVKPVERPRLMLMCHYTSPAAWSDPDLAIEGTIPDWYTPRQLAAVAGCLG